ncbi:hypothetical protein D9603_00935 [Pseudoalteromonas sp. PS5]|nr:hypothetical protein D9603_00935 [Pseudoalteromonas sp. PS5]
MREHRVFIEHNNTTQVLPSINTNQTAAKTNLKEQLGLVLTRVSTVAIGVFYHRVTAFYLLWLA